MHSGFVLQLTMHSEVQHSDHNYTVVLTSYSSISDKLVSQWHDLTGRLLEENIYLSPGFAMPAIEYSGDQENIRVMHVHDLDDDGRLVGLGLFRDCRGSWRFPFRILKAYKSPHTFITGFLLDSERPSEVMKAISGFFQEYKYRWYGVEFKDFEWEGKTTQLMRESVVGSAQWYEVDIVDRAFIADVPNSKYTCFEKMNKKYKKNLQRAKKNISEVGDLRWRILKNMEITDETIDTFLELEHKGWKGDAGTSLKADKKSRQFFYALMNNLGRTNVFYTELLLNDKVIASTCNLHSNKNGFAFKVAWDPGYAKYSPGMLNELEFVLNSHDLCDFIKNIDSGASTGSFIEKLWFDRKTMVSGIFVYNHFATIYCKIIEVLRNIKRQIST